MKRVILILMAVIQTEMICAQYHLIGTSYLQKFDHIANGLPQGWEVYTGATAGSLGNPDTLITAASSWGSSTGFRNYASWNNGLSSNAGTSDQNNAVDRALGVRQTGTAGYDPGAAFVFAIANTSGLSNFKLSFRLQSLNESAARTTTWSVDYGTGAAPTVFTTVNATGTLTTGNSTYESHTVNVDFGSGLDNLPGPVRIRILALSASSGTGTRTATAIDDFELSWTGNSAGSGKPAVVALFPPNGAAYVPVSSVPAITFNRVIRKGASGNVYLTNETDQRVDTIPVVSSGVRINGYEAILDGAVLKAGNSYHINFDSIAFDTAGNVSLGMYRANDWQFSTAPEVLTLHSLDETFDAACDANELPPGWQKISKKGSAQWQCHTAYNITSYRITAYSGGKYSENEDWLISPRVDLTSGNDASLLFRLYKKRKGTEPGILVSTDFPGYGDPGLSSWNPLAVPMRPADTLSWILHSAALTDYLAQPFFLAFRYLSTDSNGYEVRIDSVFTANRSIVEREENQSRPGIRIAGIPSPERIQIQLRLPEEGICRLELRDILGRRRYVTMLDTRADRQQEHVLTGLDLPPGLYIIRLEHARGAYTVKAMVQ